MVKTMKRTVLLAVAVLLCSASGRIAVHAAENDATNRTPIQTFYLPIPKEDLLETLTVVHDGAGARFFKIRVDNLANEVR